MIQYNIKFFAEVVEVDFITYYRMPSFREMNPYLMSSA